MGLNYFLIGRRIREKRKRQKLSQAMLAEMIDKSPTYISHIEKGSKSMSLETLVQIVNALETTADLLLIDQIPDAPSISAREISAMLADCDKEQRLFLIDLLKAAKTSLHEHWS